MATPAKVAAPPALPKRKKPRRVKYVSFTLPDWDKPFKLPTLNELTQAEQWAIASGDVNRLPIVLGDYVSVIEQMTDTEVEVFMDAWDKASEMTPGESEAASVL